MQPRRHDSQETKVKSVRTFPRVFMCHFIVYNFHDTIFNVYVQYCIDWSGETSGAGSLCVMLFCFHRIQLVLCNYKSRSCEGTSRSNNTASLRSSHMHKNYFTPNLPLIKQTITNDVSFLHLTV